MTTTCPCGGKFRRSDIEGYWDQKFNRTLYRDKDPYVANWKCDKCGAVRTQKKRLAKEKQPAIIKKRELKFFYGPDDNHNYRWWRNDNAGDQFDIIDFSELKRRIVGADMCKIPVVSHLPGFCSDGDNCPDHLGYH